MENGAFTTSTDLDDKLLSSLTSFVRLYDQRMHRVCTTSENFLLVATEVLDLLLVSVNELGSNLGKYLGGISGGIFSAIYALACGDNAVHVTVGCSIFGGAVGGALSGAVGSLVGISDETTGSPVCDVIRDIAWLNIGFAAGGAVGGVFGGTVGATSSALGALMSTKVAVSLTRNIICSFPKSKEGKKHLEKKQSGNMKMLNVIRDFRGAIKPLVEELKTVGTICDKMDTSDDMQSVAAQTTATLASVTEMEEIIRESCKAECLLTLAVGIEKAAKRSKRINEELERMRTEVETFLVSRGKTA